MESVLSLTSLLMTHPGRSWLIKWKIPCHTSRHRVHRPIINNEQKDNFSRFLSLRHAAWKLMKKLVSKNRAQVSMMLVKHRKLKGFDIFWLLWTYKDKASNDNWTIKYPKHKDFNSECFCTINMKTKFCGNCWISFPFVDYNLVRCDIWSHKVSFDWCCYKIQHQNRLAVPKSSVYQSQAPGESWSNTLGNITQLSIFLVPNLFNIFKIAKN